MQVVVFALGVGSTVADAAQLVAAFKAICAEHAAVSPQPHAASPGQQHTLVVQATSTRAAAAVATDSTADASGSNRWAVGNSLSQTLGSSRAAGSSPSSQLTNSSVDMQSTKLCETDSPGVNSNDLRYQSQCQHMTPRDAFFAVTERSAMQPGQKLLQSSACPVILAATKLVLCTCPLAASDSKLHLKHVHMPTVGVQDPDSANLCRVESKVAANRVSAELLCPYPPGVPLAIPGEILTQQVIHSLLATLAGGGSVTGASDPSLATFLVVEEKQQKNPRGR